MKSLAKKIEENLPVIERKFWWHKARRKIIQSTFFNDLKATSKPEILSVGCSTGAEIEFLSKFGNVTAIDIDEVAIKSCQKKGLNVIRADINNNSLPDNSYDIIVVMDVIEHIPDDQKTINELHRILRPKGKLLVTVPALMCLWSSFDDYGDFPHQRRYNKKNLTKLISKKFQIKKLSYYNFLLLPAIYLNRKLSKNPLNQLQLPHPIINRTLYTIFSFERFLLKFMNLPIGSSLITIAQKQ